MLRLENIKSYYGRMQVLRGINLTISQGEFVCLIGPNGAGKTTLLHAICGVTPIREGGIFFLGKPIHRLEATAIVRRRISLVPEGRRVFAPLNVRENLVMGAYLRQGRENKVEIQKDIDYIFHIFPVLQERQKQLAGSLSGGEQQMLAIGRALMNRPRLLLLDEPSMGLAPLAVKEILKVLEHLKSTGTTLFLVEQNARIALQMSDRGYVLERGRIVIEGKREELLSNESVKHAYLGR
ncbi:MAG: ABC transporter ATP-binding protein [Thermodesulfobacteriota bacterium]